MSSSFSSFLDTFLQECSNKKDAEVLKSTLDEMISLGKSSQGHKLLDEMIAKFHSSPESLQSLVETNDDSTANYDIQQRIVILLIVLSKSSFTAKDLLEIFPTPTHTLLVLTKCIIEASNDKYVNELMRLIYELSLPQTYVCTVEEVDHADYINTMTVLSNTESIQSQLESLTSACTSNSQHQIHLIKFITSIANYNTNIITDRTAKWITDLLESALATFEVKTVCAWEEIKSEDKIYYINTQTKESVWDIPEGRQDISVVCNNTDHREIVIKCLHLCFLFDSPSLDPQSLVLSNSKYFAADCLATALCLAIFINTGASIKPELYEFFNTLELEATYRIYYILTTSTQIQIDRSTSSIYKSITSVLEPEVWEEFYDEDATCWYYYNPKTAVSLWEKPVLLDRSVWTECYDETYDSWYYYNIVSQTSQWDRPDTNAIAEEKKQPDEPRLRLLGELPPLILPPKSPCPKKKRNRRQRRTAAAPPHPARMKDVPKKYLCALNHHIMTTPVLVANYIYEQSSIEKWVKTHGSICPMTNKALPINVMQNLDFQNDLKKEIQQYIVMDKQKDIIYHNNNSANNALDADSIYDFF